jgi:hypothetical protein
MNYIAEHGILYIAAYLPCKIHTWLGLVLIPAAPSSGDLAGPDCRPVPMLIVDRPRPILPLPRPPWSPLN